MQTISPLLLRRAMMFPLSGITLIEYIEGENNGEVIMSTGIIPDDDNYSFEADFMKLRDVIAWQTYFAAFESESANAWRVIKYDVFENRLFINDNTKASGGGKEVRDVTMLNTRRNITLSRGSIVVDGVTTALGSTVRGTTLTVPMRLGGGRWYSFKTKHNGTLIQDLRPARDAMNNLCMVDLVNWILFYSSYFTNGGDPIVP